MSKVPNLTLANNTSLSLSVAAPICSDGSAFGMPTAPESYTTRNKKDVQKLAAKVKLSNSVSLCDSSNMYLYYVVYDTKADSNGDLTWLFCLGAFYVKSNGTWSVYASTNKAASNTKAMAISTVGTNKDGLGGNLDWQITLNASPGGTDTGEDASSGTDTDCDSDTEDCDDDDTFPWWIVLVVLAVLAAIGVGAYIYTRRK